jgi:hypothetical protein
VHCKFHDLLKWESLQSQVSQIKGLKKKRKKKSEPFKTWNLTEGPLGLFAIHRNKSFFFLTSKNTHLHTATKSMRVRPTSEVKKHGNEDKSRISVALGICKQILGVESKNKTIEKLANAQVATAKFAELIDGVKTVCRVELSVLLTVWQELAQIIHEMALAGCDVAR